MHLSMFRMLLATTRGMVFSYAATITHLSQSPFRRWRFFQHVALLDDLVRRHYFWSQSDDEAFSDRSFSSSGTTMHPATLR